MEEQTNIEYVIIACSVTVVFLALGFLIFVIIQKIHRHKLEAAKEILKTQNNEEIQRIKRENLQIINDHNRLKSENREIKEQLSSLSKKINDHLANP